MSQQELSDLFDLTFPSEESPPSEQAAAADGQGEAQEPAKGQERAPAPISGTASGEAGAQPAAPTPDPKAGL